MVNIDIDALADQLILSHRGMSEAIAELRFLREEVARYQHALASLKTEGSAPHERIRQLEDALKSIVQRTESIEEDQLLEQLKVDIVAQEIGWIESTARDALRRRL